ncbi:MAG: hypothetical protein U0353_32560, partial [Sandaracinus sp.]
GSGLSLEQIQGTLEHRADDRVVTSSLGVGTDYDERFMTGVAEAGRGNYAFLRQGSELEGFLTRELEESGATVAENVVARVSLPPGVHFVEAHGTLANALSDRVELPVGTVFAGEHRKVVLSLRLDAGAVGDASTITARVGYERASDHAPQSLEGAVAVRFVASEAEAIASIDDEIHPDAFATVMDARQRDAMLAWQNGDRAQAVTLAEANRAAYEEANRRRPSRVFAERSTQIADDLGNFERVEAQSARGQSWGRARRADILEDAYAY